MAGVLYREKRARVALPPLVSTSLFLTDPRMGFLTRYADTRCNAHELAPANLRLGVVVPTPHLDQLDHFAANLSQYSLGLHACSAAIVSSAFLLGTLFTRCVPLLPVRYENRQLIPRPATSFSQLAVGCDRPVRPDRARHRIDDRGRRELLPDVVEWRNGRQDVYAHCRPSHPSLSCFRRGEVTLTSSHASRCSSCSSASSPSGRAGPSRRSTSPVPRSVSFVYTRNHLPSRGHTLTILDDPATLA